MTRPPLPALSDTETADRWLRHYLRAEWWTLTAQIADAAAAQQPTAEMLRDALMLRQAWQDLGGDGDGF